ncbi:hypothetical protein OAR97_07220 [Arcobacteraceae bacterium]|nr:hypothetical protein [Arcobacteraceae bacterium]
MKKSIILVLVIGILSSVQANGKFYDYNKPQHKVYSKVHHAKNHIGKQKWIKRQMKKNQNEIAKLQDRIMHLRQQNRKHHTFLNNKSRRDNILSFNLMFK